MDPQVRGQLFVEQEDLQKKVAALRASLSQMGQELERFGRDLKGKPENVTFSNAPNGLGNMPPELAFGGQQPYEWGISHRIEQVAQMIQDLRSQEHQLGDVQRRLATG